VEKLDLKDKKILFYLDVDSRQSFSNIGRKIGIHKDTVADRIKRLQEIGIIRGFYTVIDTSPIGYIHPRFYLTYQYATPDIKKEIIKYFVNSKYVGFVHESEGSHELALVLVVKNLPEFNEFWNKTMLIYRDYFSEQIFSLYISENMYNYSFFFDDNSDERQFRKKIEVFGGKNRIDIDDFDIRLLKLITPNARMPTIEIANNLNATTTTIKNRIKKLSNAGVIKGFKVDVDFPKLGYKFYKADIVLKNIKKYDKILQYIESNPYLNHTMKSIGYVDLEIMFYLNNSDQLHNIMSDLTNKFPEAIKSYTYNITIKTYKWNYMPED
jgi:DNA-binding Lrp family transcriptional regulator